MVRTSSGKSTGFVGRSLPPGNELPFSQLTIENAAGDTHRIIQSLREFYTDRWVTTGVSKGGITAVYHSFFYPEDVDGSVPYVAPASVSRIDPRYQVFLDNLEPAACREAMRSYQVETLSRRATMGALVMAELGLPTVLDGERFLDFLVAIVDWGFWQGYGVNFCDQIPGPVATDAELWGFVATLLGWDQTLSRWWSRNPRRDNAVYSYEWLTEQGFADQVGEHLTESLVHVRPTMEEIFIASAPVALPAYDSSVTEATRAWVATEAKNMVLIYGQNDPWSGGQLDISDEPSSAKFIVPNANHGASIGALPANRPAAGSRLGVCNDGPLAC